MGTYVRNTVDTNATLNPNASNTSTVTATSVLLVSVVIAVANPLRKGFTIWNNGANSAYITFGPVSNASSPNIILATFASYTMTTGVIWTGALSALRNAGSGNIVVRELL